MRRTVFYVIVLCIVIVLEIINVSPTIAAITITTVPVGNPGNAPDGLYGEVDYNYSIGKYDVTVGQYTAFLNAVAATDTYHLYNSNMASDPHIAGIAQNGTSGSYTYSVIGSANHPIAGAVSWYDGARFANWLSNGQPTGTEGPGTTETGSYTLNGSNPISVARNANATWVIPTENEWYKAAYYNPATSSYYLYPYSSNTFPTSASPGNIPNTGNFLSNSGLFAVTGSGEINGSNYLTDVGAYTASASPSGAYDMGGNVEQWTETMFSAFRIVRGAAWEDGGGKMESLFGGYGGGVSDLIGFRVALVPEPSTLALLALSSIGLLVRHRVNSG